MLSVLSTPLFKPPQLQLREIKLRWSRRYLTRKDERIISVPTENLFPVQIFPFQNSRYVTASLSRMKVLFPLDLGSSLTAYLMSLFPSLYYDVPSLFLAIVPFSILRYFATPPIALWGFPRTISPILSSLSRPIPCVSDLNSSRMLLNFHSMKQFKSVILIKCNTDKNNQKYSTEILTTLTN